MTTFKRILKALPLFLLMNFRLLSTGVKLLLSSAGISGPGGTAFNFFLSLILLIALLVPVVILEIVPCREKGLDARLQILAGGYELILSSIYALLGELCLLLVIWLLRAPLSSLLSDLLSMTEKGILILYISNAVIAYFLLLFHYLNGFWRTAFCSAQLGFGRRLSMLFFWWIFPINIVLFHKWCTVVRRELITAKNKYLLEITRVGSDICRTKYPVVMVHGIFFRDWQYLNYWGRIPKALKHYGADVYYGKQQSSLAVADSAKELKSEIERVLAQTGAEKVNIVAHSKGGLDSRYAISKLGMSEYVASLTTINTPHRGCQFADALLGSLPQWLINFVARRYNTLFHTLGDQTPDFLAGVNDLTAAACAKFNEEVKDAPGVYYQSIMSKMYNHKSSFFPLSLSYFLVKKYEGENDGLVSVTSAPWGNYLGLYSAGKHGVSHADMIDLTHKDIKGFDVGEFYVKLFEELKKKGF